MINYLINASICLAAGYLFYWLLLSRQKFLGINRMFLLLIVLASLVFPLLEVSWTTAPTKMAQVLTYVTLPPMETTATSTPSTRPIDIVSVIYLSGLVLSSLFFVWKLISVVRVSRQGRKEEHNGLRLIRTNQKQAFSFFGSIFLPQNLDLDKQETAHVIRHELEHVKGLHSVDLLVLEVAKVLLWFNPIVYALGKALKLEHEFIADEAVIRTHGIAAYEQTLVRMALKGQGIPLSHSFARFPLDKRFKMIYKPKTNTMQKLKILFALPLFAVLFITVSCNDAAEEPIEEIEVPIEIEEQVELLKRSLEEQLEMLKSQGMYEVPVKVEPIVGKAMIKGMLTNARDNAPIANATVTSMPSGNKTISDAEGKYQVDAPKSDTVVVYFADGFEPMNVPRLRYSKVNVTLRSKADIN